MFDKLKKSHKPYGKKIMFELYPDKQLDITAICSKFLKKRHAIIKASIKDLEKCHLLQRLDSPSSKASERLYKLSKEGYNLIDGEIDKLQLKEESSN